MYKAVFTNPKHNVNIGVDFERDEKEAFEIICELLNKGFTAAIVYRKDEVKHDDD